MLEMLILNELGSFGLKTSETDLWRITLFSSGRTPTNFVKYSFSSEKRCTFVIAVTDAVLTGFGCSNAISPK